MPVEVIIKVAFILFVVVGAFTPIITWVERKQSAVMQDRIGANRADVAGITIIGLFHPVADALKLMIKEDVVPRGANRIMHLVAPMVGALPAIIAFAVIPYGGVYTFGEKTISLVAANPDWGLLYIFAVGSLATYGAVMAGWASNNNWSLLGGLRATAQMISYEVTMGLSVVGIFMVFSTLQLQDMVLAQDGTLRVFGFMERLFGVPTPWLDWVRVPAWGIVYQPLGFILFFTCVIAENKRPPFDLPEAESEIVAGYFLEYSGMRFGLFYLAEFIEIVVIAGLVSTLFFGGWTIPYLSQETIIGAIAPALGEGFATGVCLLLHVSTFLIKMVAMIWLQMALRWTLPRFRYDQVMSLCWKAILPLSIANIFVTGFVILLVRG
jgi:NADH-quinone oxidoreductase subunit H